MNRLYHLRETLPVNIEQNKQFVNVEFVVLDYNSKDDMENWVRTNLSEYVESGLLKYYKTFEPTFFNMSHSKNLISRLATGNIICNVDADNYAGPDYAGWVNSLFPENEKKSILTTIRKTEIPYRDQGGKLCFHKEMLYSVNGYDESLVGYGIDDVDFVNRLEKAGGNRIFIDNPHYLKYIDHSDEERLKNLSFNNKLANIYLLATSNLKTRNTVLYLLKDKTCYEVDFEFDEQLRPNPILSYGGWVVQKNGHRKGTFEKIPGSIALNFEHSDPVIYKEDQPGLLNSFNNHDKLSWKHIAANDKLYGMLVKAYSECLNRFKYTENDKAGNNINTTGWGKGTVYLNFDTSNPIRIN